MKCASSNRKTISMNEITNHSVPIICDIYVVDGKIEKATLSHNIDANSCSWNVWFCTNTKNREEVLEAIRKWLIAYFSNAVTNDLPLKLYGTDFRQKVLRTLYDTSVGTTMSYQDLAHCAGNLKAARAVGSCCKENPIPFFIPCHRVIKKNGSFGEFLFGVEMKRAILLLEKAICKN